MKSNKRKDHSDHDPDWYPGDCLKLIYAPQTSDRSYAELYADSLSPGNIFRLIKFTNHTKNIVLIDTTPLKGSINIIKKQDTQPEDTKLLSLNETIDLNDYEDVSEVADVSVSVAAASQMLDDAYDDTYDIHDDSNDATYDVLLRLPASLFVKVDCDEPDVVISYKPIRKAPQKEAVQEAVRQKAPLEEYGIISASIDALNSSISNPYLTKNGDFVMDTTNKNRLFKFEIVKIKSKNNQNSTFTVDPIEDTKKEYNVSMSNVTPFTSMAGQDYLLKTTGKKVRAKSLDANTNGNIIVERQEKLEKRELKFISVNPTELITTKGSNAETEMSNFYSVTLRNEEIADMGKLETMCEVIPEAIRNNPGMLNPQYNNSILFGISKYYKIGSCDDCFIEYMIEDDETIYVEKFMCYGENKGTGNDLFCAFLFYIIHTYPSIKYIKLIAQPRYVSTSPPSNALKKILQKMLNNYYRKLQFLKIDTDNEFMGCISEFIKPCLQRITSVSSKDEERYLNDQKVGGSKLTKIKSKKRRKSIKKNNMKRKKTKKRRKSIRKRK
jgi:hypothetical protein